MSIGDISTKTLIGEKEQIFLTGVRLLQSIKMDRSLPRVLAFGLQAGSERIIWAICSIPIIRVPGMVLVV